MTQYHNVYLTPSGRQAVGVAWPSKADAIAITNAHTLADNNFRTLYRIKVAQRVPIMRVQSP